MNTDDIKTKVRHICQLILKFRVLVFGLVLVMLYGFIVWRVNTYVKAQPDASAVASQSSSSRQPRIDQATINKIQQLQDNSVNVQTLFDQARQNPFQE